jgi:hypothetical protein
VRGLRFYYVHDQADKVLKKTLQKNITKKTSLNKIATKKQNRPGGGQGVATLEA